jgi:hypothetical protein
MLSTPGTHARPLFSQGKKLRCGYAILWSQEKKVKGQQCHDHARGPGPWRQPCPTFSVKLMLSCPPSPHKNYCLLPFIIKVFTKNNSMVVYVCAVVLCLVMQFVIGQCLGLFPPIIIITNAFWVLMKDDILTGTESKLDHILNNQLSLMTEKLTSWKTDLLFEFIILRRLYSLIINIGSICWPKVNQIGPRKEGEVQMATYYSVAWH